jgi:glutamate racemase
MPAKSELLFWPAARNDPGMKLPRLGSGLLLTACLALVATAATPPAIVEQVASHPDGRAAFTFNAAAYQGDLSALPIGVFDSGIGGLTVLEAIYQLDAFNNETHAPGADGRPDFERERFIYLGDQANMPYGNYPASGKTEYLRELVIKDAVFLLGQRAWATGASAPHFDKPAVKAIVIACNTATAYGLADIRAAIARWGVPVFVVGVVEAGARGVTSPAAGQPAEAVAVFATVGTCASEAYPRAIAAHLRESGQPAAPVIQQGSPVLAGAIEGDPASLLPGLDASASVSRIIRKEIAALVEAHRQSGATAPIGSIVLGCTHYPLVQDEIARAFAELRQADERYRPLIAERMDFVNPAELTAKELYQQLVETKRLLRPGATATLGRDAFYISVANPASPGLKLDAAGGLEKTYKYGRNPGQFTVEDTKNVPMQIGDLPAASARLVREKLPAVARRLE